MCVCVCVCERERERERERDRVKEFCLSGIKGYFENRNVCMYAHIVYQKKKNIRLKEWKSFNKRKE